REHAGPEYLGVVVGVDVARAGGGGGAVGVERAVGSSADVAECRDASGADADVAAASGGAGAVDEGAAANQEVEVFGHGWLLLKCGRWTGITEAPRSSCSVSRVTSGRPSRRAPGVARPGPPSRRPRRGRSPRSVPAAGGLGWAPRSSAG